MGTQNIVPVHVPFMKVTHTPIRVELLGKIFYDTPLPPTTHGTTKSHPWAWPNPVWYVIYLLFVRRYTKFGLKIFEIDFVIQI